METKRTNIMTQNKNILLIALAVGLILLLPLIAMQFTDQVAWSAADFATAGVLLFAAGLAFELISRKVGTFAYRAAVGAAVGTAVLLIWSNLAVGLIGSEDNLANQMYFGVIAVLAVGSLIARLRPLGMTRALLATALAQAVVAVIALLVVKDLPVYQTLMINGFFAALWIGSAVLFRWAHATQKRTLA